MDAPAIRFQISVGLVQWLRESYSTIARGTDVPRALVYRLASAVKVVRPVPLSTPP
jgi:hypothetical protein